MLALVAAGAVAGVVALALLFVVNYLRPSAKPSESAPTSALPPAAQPPTASPRKPRPDFQDASCPDVQVVSVPGTWESSRELDPSNPAQFPNALLLNVTAPLSQQYDAGRVQFYTVPYTAQFHRPFSTDNEMSYDDSRDEGMNATRNAITEINNRCPLTSYVIVGFSQGAVIAGDLASDIGNGRGPVDEDLVLGVTLIADGRRDTGVGQEIGPNPPGQGAEITLQDVPTLSGSTMKLWGITMTGARDGGFGALNDRTNEICAQDDLICAAPAGAFDISKLAGTIETLAGAAGPPVHALYNTTQFWSIDGQPATVWTRNWAGGVLDAAPRPRHG